MTIKSYLSSVSGTGRLVIRDYWPQVEEVFEALKGRHPSVIFDIAVQLGEELRYVPNTRPLFKGDIELFWTCDKEVQLAIALQLYTAPQWR